jgi:hypothetical protein
MMTFNFTFRRTRELWTMGGVRNGVLNATIGHADGDEATVRGHKAALTALLLQPGKIDLLSAPPNAPLSRRPVSRHSGGVPVSGGRRPGSRCAAVLASFSVRPLAFSVYFL